MPNNSKATTKGKLLKNSTCLVYAPGPLVAKALEKKCSIRKRPMGMIPLSECNRRRRNECPCPARNGATPSNKVLPENRPAGFVGASNRTDEHRKTACKTENPNVPKKPRCRYQPFSHAPATLRSAPCWRIQCQRVPARATRRHIPRARTQLMA